MTKYRQDIDSDVYREDFQWREGDLTVTRTTQWSAPGCHNGCQVLFYTDDEGKLVKVEGDPNGPFNKGRLCMRCLDLIEAVYNPDRLKYPMRRTGPRGSNQWERISWDEALDEIEAKAREIADTYSTNAITVCTCTARNANGLANALGWAVFDSTTTGMSWNPGESCYLPRMTAMGKCLGAPFVADCAQMYEDSFDNPQWRRPDYMLIWGNNPLVANADGFFGHWVVDLMRQGTKLIVIDPEINWLGARAEIVLQVRPGSDSAVAMAMLQVIFEEDLYDHEFCEKWCYGLDELMEAVKDMTPEEAGKIAGVDPELIRAAARAFATSEVASIQWGVAVDFHVHAGSTCLAIMDLSAVCGFIDVPGGNVFPTGAFDMGAWMGLGFGISTPNVQDRSEGNWDNILGYREYPLRRSDLNLVSSMLVEEIETGGDKATHMLWITNNNPLPCAGSEAQRVLEDLQKIDYIVGADVFLTPTLLAVADIVLPLAMSCERDSIREWWAPLRSISKVSSYYEAKSDEEVFLLMGKRMRPEAFAQWDTPRDMLNDMMKNRSELTFEQLEQQVYEFHPFEYRKYEKGMLRRDGEPGFDTPSGKIELYSLVYEACDLPAVPYHAEPPTSPLRTPELFEEYPFVLTTGRRSYEFFHSEHRQLETMREFHPVPLVRINDEDAAEYGIQEGDWIWIQNIYGKFKQKAHIEPGLKKGVISSEHGWWFPERDPDDGTLFGTFECNSNNCTTQSDVGPSGYGTSIKEQLCKIYKVTPENDHIELTAEEEARSRATRSYPRPETVLY